MFLNKKNSKKSPSADRRNLSCFCSQILIIFPGSDENAPETALPNVGSIQNNDIILD